MGADFKEVETYATSTFGISASNTINTTSDQRVRAMTMNAVKTTSYMCGDDAAMEWTEQEKKSVS